MATKMHNVPPDVDFESSRSVKGLFSAEAPISSFAEVRMGLITEQPKWKMKMKGKRMIRKMRETVTSAEWVSLLFDAAHSMIRDIIGNLYFMSFASVRSTATMRYWMTWMKNATFGIDEKVIGLGRSLHIHGGDGASLQVLLGSLIRTSSVHFVRMLRERPSLRLPDLFSVIYQFFQHLAEKASNRHR